MRIRIFLFSLIGIILYASVSTAAPPPGFKKTYYAYGHVYDQSGSPKSGVEVEFMVMCYNGYHGSGQTYTDWAYGTTNSNGWFYITIQVNYWQYPYLSYMIAYVSDDRYITLSSQNNSSRIGSEICPTFTVMHDEDNNGIDDEWKLQLAEKFCPTLKLHHPTEWIAPEPVEITAHTLYLDIYDYPNALNLIDVVPLDILNYPFNYSDYEWLMCFDDPPGGPIEYLIAPHFEWSGLSGNTPSSWIPSYENERIQNNYDHTIYAHFLKYYDDVIIQYWFFYPYNDGYNNHEGDWEHINVILTNGNPSTASIKKIDFYFHHKVKTCTSGYQVENNTHPIVYVGGSCAGIDWPASCEPGNTTGGSYPWSGTWYNIGTHGADEYVHGYGPTIHYSEFIDGNQNDNRGIVILPDPDIIDYNQTPRMSWLNADIAWGHVNVDSPWDWNPFQYDNGDIAPCGPYHNKGWEKFGAVSGDGGYENY